MPYDIVEATMGMLKGSKKFDKIDVPQSQLVEATSDVIHGSGMMNERGVSITLTKGKKKTITKIPSNILKTNLSVVDNQEIVKNYFKGMGDEPDLVDFNDLTIFGSMR